MDPKKIFPLKIASLCCFFTMLYALFGFQGIGRRRFTENRDLKFLKGISLKVNKLVGKYKLLIYLSLKAAGRFSAKADMPSFWSSVAKVA